jgi:glycosyltransferase involved in cell wall biosynthesis
VAFTAVSQVAAEPVRRMLGGGAEVRVLPNGVDVGAWRPVEASAVSPDEVRIVSAMRLVRRKRPIPLLRMMSRVRAKVPASITLRLVVLGEGPARRAMQRRAARAGLSGWVELPGRVAPDELRAAYAAGDVYVAPARLESFGIAALEARAAGLPVVARSDGGVREFVADGVEGLLGGDDAGLVDAIARLAVDPVLRQRISSYNLLHPPIQDWTHVLRRADEEYVRATRLIGNASGAGRE